MKINYFLLADKISTENAPYGGQTKRDKII